MPASERIVIVGASLAGWSAADSLRKQGFTGQLTVIGDEPHEPYDRPPLSKAVLSGWLGTDHLQLPRVSGDWMLGTAATELKLPERVVVLADGSRVPFDRLLIATGTRGRPWPQPAEGEFKGVHVLRDRDDADRIRAALAASPRRVLVVGGGFTGSEVASSCRDLGIEVTLVQRGAAPLASAIGAGIGEVFAEVQREAGVDLRLNTTVAGLEDDGTGQVRRARLSDGDVLDVDLVVAALGSVRNTEWLAGSGIAADGQGVVCDAACRVLAPGGAVIEGVFAAGDVARCPHPLNDGQLLAVEHWGNAVDQGNTAAHNMLRDPADHRTHTALPMFWSDQFRLNIKSVGLPASADEVMITQGSPQRREFVAAYGRGGRLVGALAVNSPRVLDGYAALIEEGAAFPPGLNAPDSPPELVPVAAGFSR